MLNDSQRELLKHLRSGWRLYTMQGTLFLTDGKEPKKVSPAEVSHLIEECLLDPVTKPGKIQWVVASGVCDGCADVTCSCATASSLQVGGAP